MSNRKQGQQTLLFPSAPALVGWGNAAGKKEGEGPLGGQLDELSPDDTFGQKTWEQAECVMQQRALTHALARGGRKREQLDILLAGDLVNQCICSSFAAREQQAPFLGLYGACSTMGEGLLLCAALVDAGYADLAAAVTSSHFCTAERQYRTPVQYGGQRTPTAQWTVTGAGAVLVSGGGKGPRITGATVGRVVDKGVTDANNMGAAMAPAAFDTLQTHFRDTGRTPEDYDLILTGDLGKLGHEILTDLFAREGIKLTNCSDCGLMIYDPDKQDVHCGGSGCGCSATVLTARLLPALARGQRRRVLFCPTGALLSPTSTQQGESIPSVCHALVLEGPVED